MASISYSRIFWMPFGWPRFYMVTTKKHIYSHKRFVPYLAGNCGRGSCVVPEQLARAKRSHRTCSRDPEQHSETTKCSTGTVFVCRLCSTCGRGSTGGTSGTCYRSPERRSCTTQEVLKHDIVRSELSDFAFFPSMDANDLGTWWGGTVHVLEDVCQLLFEWNPEIS